MRTRTKKKYVASDRARRENVPRHILFYGLRAIGGKMVIKIWNRCVYRQERGVTGQ